jgi:hypothetical protein
MISISTKPKGIKASFPRHLRQQAKKEKQLRTQSTAG